MPFDRFLIAPFSTGLETDLKPFLIPEDAFASLTNAYVFRGRVRKRFGSYLMGSGADSAVTAQLFSRVRINLGNTDAVTGNFSATVPGAIFKIGQAFSIGDTIFTVYQTGVPAAMLTTGVATGTYNTTNGAVVITGNTENPVTPVWFYPAQPIMGLTNYEVGPINNQPSYAFDTQFAYKFSGGFWQRSGAALWHGNDLNFFWTTNWEGDTDNIVVMYVTNFNATVPAPGAKDDPIWYTVDGAVWTAASGVKAFYFAPAGGAPHTGPYVKTSRLIVPFKNRLLLLSTVENDNSGGAGINTAYVNRCRFSHNGSPLATNAWYEPNQSDNAGTATSNADGGGFEDATTEEAIISAEFIKDRLIVYFERSTWELAYTGNEIRPFIWQKINTELGSEAQQSSVPFDKVILTIGNTGVHACNGANVERIDNKIPDQIFQIKDKNIGVQRIAGIRDYFTEMVYWIFPSDNENPSETYPNRIFVYNYRNNSWAFNEDCFTAFGYFEQQGDMTWASTNFTWEQAAFDWNSGVTQSQFRQVIAGNQEGFVLIINPDISRNAPAMQITNMAIGSPSVDFVTLIIIDHTLSADDYIAVETPQGISLPIKTIYQITNVVDKDTVVILAPDITGTYLGGGTAARVSNLGILSKEWNPYLEKDRNVYLQRIDFGVEATADGEVTVDYFPSSTEVSMLNLSGPLPDAIMGTGVLETKPYDPTIYPLEQFQQRLWHPVYFQTSGECVQIFIAMSNAQITNPTIAWEDFQLDAMVLYTQPISARMQ